MPTKYHASATPRTAFMAAALVCIAGTASAQSSVQVFGTIDSGIQTRNKSAANTGKLTTVLSGGIRPSVWGLKGSEDLGDGMKAFFNLESHYLSDTGVGIRQLFGRQANVGISSGWGTVTLGRQYSPAIIGTIGTEPRAFKEQFSNLYVWAYNQLAGTGLPLTGATPHSNDVGVFVGNAVQYSNAFGPVNFGVSYSFGEQAGDMKKGREVSIGASYNGPVTLGFGYQSVADTASGEDVSKLYSVGAAVPFGALTGKVNYINVKNNDPATGTEISKVDSIGAGIDFKWNASNTATLALYHTKYKGLDSSSKTRSLVVSNDYSLSKRTTLYAQLAYVDADSVGAADVLENLKGTISQDGSAPNAKTTLVGVGIHHTF